MLTICFLSTIIHRFFGNNIIFEIREKLFLRLVGERIKIKKTEQLIYMKPNQILYTCVPS